ncbi:hypothetical protein GGR57DRAFT_462357, partial [Xylariaceae sp. FL1272]
MAATYADIAIGIRHNWPDREVARNFVERLILTPSIYEGEADSRVDLSVAERKVVNQIYGWFIGRHVLTTESGYMELATKSTAVSDEVCIILGRHVPMVLRHVDDDKRLVVGQYHLEELSRGEGVLGPLPDGVGHQISHSCQFIRITQATGRTMILASMHGTNPIRLVFLNLSRATSGTFRD